MIEVTPKIFTDFFIKNWKNILLGVFVLLFLYQSQCSGSNEVLAENVSIKREAEAHLNNAKMFEQKNIALQKDYEILEDSIKIYKENEKKLIASREVIKEKKVAKTAKIEKYNASQIVIHTQERYGVDSTKVKTTSEGTLVKDDVMVDILVEVEEGDFCKQEVENLESQIKEKNKIEEEKDKQILNVLNQNDNLSLANLELKSTNDLISNALNNTESALKKEKNGKTFWKTTTFVAIATIITKSLIDNKN